MSLADRLRNARHAAGLSQRAAARHLGIAAASLAQWEIGRTRPDLDRLPSIAALYLIPLTDLLEDAAPANFEAELLRLFRSLPDDKRKTALALLSALAS